MMVDPDNIADLITALHRHPDCLGMVVWQPIDCKMVGIDPALVDWDHVEESMCYDGWETIGMYHKENV